MNIDIVSTTATDLVADITRLPMIPDDSVEEIRMDAVLEHLYRHEREAALLEWRRILQPGGTLTISYIPDFAMVADAYVNRLPGVISDPMQLEEVYRYTHGDPVPWNAGEQLHKDLFTRESTTRDLERAGFEVIRLENVCFRDERVPLNLNVVARKVS